MVRKCHKIIYFAKHQKHIVLSRIRIRIFKTGSADPDPEKIDRIRNTGLNEVGELHKNIFGLKLKRHI